MSCSRGLSLGFSLLLLALAGTGLRASEAPRKWTNQEGRSVTGSLVEKGDGWVKIEIRSKVHKIELNTLSKADQEYVEKVKLSKKFALRVTTESGDAKTSGNNTVKAHVELEGVDDRHLYCLLVWISQLQSSKGTRIRHVIEAFYDKDGKYTHEATFSSNRDGGQIYRGYAVRVMDQEGNTLAETAEPPSNLSYLDKARTSYKPKPKESADGK